MKKDLNKQVIRIVVVVCILLLGWLLVQKNQKTEMTEGDESIQLQDDQDTESATNTVTEKTSPDVKKSAIVVPKVSEAISLGHDTDAYMQARQEYGNYKIQLSSCSATPVSLLAKKGKTILVDGFSSGIQTVYIGEQMVVLNGNEAVAVTLDRVGTWGVYCELDGKYYYNVSTVTVVE